MDSLLPSFPAEECVTTIVCFVVALPSKSLSCGHEKPTLCKSKSPRCPPFDILKVIPLNTLEILTCDTWCPEVLFGTCLTDVFGVYLALKQMLLFLLLHLLQVVRGSLLKTLKPLIRTHSGGLSHTLNGRSLTFITSSAGALKGSRGNPIKCVYVCVWEREKEWEREYGMGPRAGVEVSDLPCLSSQSSQTAQVFPEHSTSHTLISGLLFVSWR